jgi:putative transposase
MARLSRRYLLDCYHAIQRGNNRDACFYDEADYKAYLAFLKDAAAKYEVASHNY